MRRCFRAPHVFVFLSILLGMGLMGASVAVAQAGDAALTELLRTAEREATEGRAEAALMRLQDARETHPHDPRLHLAMARLLRQMGRLGEACDAIEAAVEAVELAEQNGRPDLVRATQSDIKRLADEWLAFRREAMKEIGDYRDKAARLAVQLARANRPEGAAFLIEEMQFVMDPHSPAIAHLHRQCGTELAARAPRADDAQSVNDNDPLRSAERAMRSRDFSRAYDLAMAAWKRNPTSREPAILAAEALAAQNRSAQAVALALRAMNLEPGDRDARALDRRITALLRPHGRETLAIAELRSAVIAKLLRVRRKAERANEAHNLAWIDDLLARLAPCDSDVKSAVGGDVSARLAARQQWLQRHQAAVDPANPAAGSGDAGNDDEVDRLMADGDEFLDRGNQLVADTRADGFDHRRLKSTLQQAIQHYESALAKYREAQRIQPGNRTIDQAITHTNRQIYWARKSMPID